MATTTASTTANPLTQAATAVDPTVGKQTGTSSSLSPWAGPYVTEMLGKGWALSDMPYQSYTGQLTAGPSNLQNQAFQGLASLTTPASIGQAASTAGDIASKSMGLNYSPTSFSSGYTAPNQYATGVFDPGYKAPETYAAANITTDQFTPQQAQQYMSPYLQSALNPQIAEARREAEIQRVLDAGRLTKAGAYGGSRQAIMESEAARNLMSNLANITGKGYQTAYEQAQQAFTTDQARALEAQRAAEQSRQFGYGQQMTAADLAARYGLDAQRAAEESRQFGYGQQMTAADLAARYGLDAQRAAEQSKQFGADYGLRGLQNALQAATAQGQLGVSQSEADRRNIEAQMAGGATQRDITQQGLAADYAQFAEQRDFPYKQTQYMQSLLQGLPIETQTVSYAQPSTLSNILGSAGGIKSLYDTLFG